MPMEDGMYSVTLPEKIYHFQHNETIESIIELYSDHGLSVRSDAGSR